MSGERGCGSAVFFGGRNLDTAHSHSELGHSTPQLFAGAIPRIDPKQRLIQMLGMVLALPAIGHDVCQWRVPTSADLRRGVPCENTRRAIFGILVFLAMSASSGTA